MEHVYLPETRKIVNTLYYEITAGGIEYKGCYWIQYFILYAALGGLWFDHVLSWWKHRDDPNILFLTYEDRIKVRK